MTDMQIRKGFMKFVRLGPIKFNKQVGVPHAPEKWGIWAFPDPYFTWEYAMQQYYDHMPFEAKVDWEKGEEWLKNNRHKVARKSTFWYRGNVYCHFLPNGELGVDSRMYSIVDPDWTLMDVTTYAKLLKKHRIDQRGVGEYKDFKYDTEFSEVFIPRGEGRIRHNAP